MPPTELPGQRVSDSTAQRVNSALADRYRVERLLGAGGMAVVYLARDLKHDRLVALKLFRPNVSAAVGAQRFLNEVRLTARLQHPHIVPLHDSGEAAGCLFYVMPYVGGETLRSRLEREGRLPLQDAIEITKTVALALDYAHREDVVHRDIKPENILLHDGLAVVSDFGIALALGGPEITRLTQTGLTIGTPLYMSPEQLSGKANIDGRSDIYSLACVLYECLLGEPPFTAASPFATAAQHLVAPVPSAARVRVGLPQAVDRVLMKALSKEPLERFATAADFAMALVSAWSSAEAALAGTGSRTGVYIPASSGGHQPGFSKLARPQDIRFCTTVDGVKIAYATMGDGYPLVKAANWLSHLEFDWQSPMWRHWWAGLSRHNRLIRYDERGCGLSDWNAAEMSLDAWVGDLEAVIEAVKVDRFALLGVSQGGAIAITYAVRHPEKVSHLILHGAFARGRRNRESQAEREGAELELQLIRHGWGQENPAFRQVFSTLFFPQAALDQLEWFNELQRVSATPSNAVRLIEAFQVIDVDDLARRVSAPTLVLHSKDDARVPFAEGRRLASLIPGARFVPLTSKNHIPLEHEPAWKDFLNALSSFIGVADQRPGGSG